MYERTAVNNTWSANRTDTDTCQKLEELGCGE